MQGRQNSDPIIGINALGEKREYVFKLMNAKNCTRVFHQYASIMTQIHDSFMALVVELSRKTNEELTEDQEMAYNLLGTDANTMFVIKELPNVFSWDTVEGLAKEMLGEHTVVIGKETLTADEEGFTSRTGDPLEMYTALLYAVEANYPTYIAPLKLRMALLFQDDSTPESVTKKTKTESPKSQKKKTR